MKAPSPRAYPHGYSRASSITTIARDHKLGLRCGHARSVPPDTLAVISSAPRESMSSGVHSLSKVDDLANFDDCETPPLVGVGGSRDNADVSG
jgi:hypothetical protein